MPGITKLSNEYQQVFGKLYDKTPKSVLAAIALSLALQQNEEIGFVGALDRLVFEWRCLYQNGIVPQKAPKENTL